jgi:hypothetical protein
MRRSSIYESIIKELKRLNKLNSVFYRKDLFELIKDHQKYSSFLYKHSDLKNQGKMTLHFMREIEKGIFFGFRIDENVKIIYFTK